MLDDSVARRDDPHVVVWGAMLLALSGDALDAQDADRERIAAHLRRAEARLRAADVAGLSAAQRVARSAAVERLHAYHVRGRFPLNPRTGGGQNPIWIDDAGTECAMAYLVRGAGDEALAFAVRRAENTAYVRDMRTPGLVDWLDRNGLTAAEAAFVQPGYCACPMDEKFVCGTDGRTYLNECVAVECGYVEVAYEGECMFETDTAQDWPMAGSEGETEDAEVEAPPEDDTESDSKSACSVGAGSANGLTWLALLLLAWGRRRDR